MSVNIAVSAMKLTISDSGLRGGAGIDLPEVYDSALEYVPRNSVLSSNCLFLARTVVPAGQEPDFDIDGVPQTDEFWAVIGGYGGGARGLAATITAGTTTTLPAGSEATVTNVGSDSVAILEFAIPKGDPGGDITDETRSLYAGTVEAAAQVTALVSSLSAYFDSMDSIKTAQDAAISSGTTDPQLLVFDPTTGLYTSFISRSIFDVEGIMDLTDFDTSRSLLAGTSTILFDEDLDGNGKNNIKSCFVQNNSDGNIAIRRRNQRAAIRGVGSVTIEPGQVWDEDYPPGGYISVISDTDGANITAGYKTSNPVNVNLTSGANRLIARSSTNLSDGQKALVRTLYTAAHDLGFHDAALHWSMMMGPTAEFACFDWGQYSEFGSVRTPIGGPTFANHRFTLNGTNQHFTTGRKWADMPGKFDGDHVAMALMWDTTAASSGHTGISSGDVGIQPNNSSTSHRFQNSATTTVNAVSGSAAGGLLISQRSDHTFYTARRNKTALATFNVDALAQLESLDHTIGAAITTSGIGDATKHMPGTPLFVYAGLPMPTAAWDQFYDAINAYITGIDTP